MRHIILSGGLILGLVLLLLFVVTDQPAQADAPCDRYVLGIDAGDSGDCSDEGDPCRTVQYAISQADPGDHICVAKHSLAGPLVYTGTVVITKSITLDGAWDGMCVDPNNLNCAFQAIPCDPANVTLDAEGAGRVISITGAIAPTIHCFTITGGDAAGLGGDPGTTVENDAGGGIYSRDAAPFITHNVITGNYGCDTCPAAYGRGGGIYLLNAPSTAVISGNVIAHNVADNSTWGRGGGVMLRDSSAQVVHNTIHDNRAGHSAGDGGGLEIWGGMPIVTDNVLRQNVAAQAVAGTGGGIHVHSSTPVTIERNVLQFNRALQGTGDPSLYNYGGGIYFAGPFAVIRDNELYGNVATLLDARGRGGGMYLQGLSAAAVVQGNVIANDNRASYASDGAGGALYLDACYATVADNHLFNNIAASESPGYGGGIYVNGGGGLIQGNVITRNLAVLGAVSGTGWGGGMALYDSGALVQDNRIVNNTADSAPNATGLGGGIYVHQGAPQIVRNDILSNTTSGGGGGSGGGLLLQEASAWVDGNTVLYNENVGTLVNNGGGIAVDSCTAFTLTNNIVGHNEADDAGSGVAIALSAGRVDNNTIVTNATGDGVGIHVNKSSTVAAYNNIVVSHTVGIVVADPGFSIFNASHTLFEANVTDYGAGVTSVDEVPAPADLLPDYHLDAGSNAIDNALPLAWITHDVDGDTRPYRGAPDVGADEVSCLAHVVGGGVYFTIQEAIGIATAGDTVRVAEGTCYENVAITESLTLEGGWNQAFNARAAEPASATTIDALGRGRAISITETSGSIAPVIDGFTLTGGDATDLGGSGGYGYDVGGGLYSWYADTTVTNCIVRANIASANGIGWGGGLGFYQGNPTVSDCRIEDNVASMASNGYGGGVYFRYGAPTLEQSIIQDNVASIVGDGRGGGVAFHFNSLTMADNIVRRNLANTDPARFGYGGGLFVYNTGASGGPGLINNIIVDNRLTGNGSGSGLYLNNVELSVLHTTLARNTGGDGQGVYAEQGATIEMANTIVVSHAVGVQASYTDTVVNLEATLWGDGAWANGIDELATCGGVVNSMVPNLWAPPSFVDSAQEDYHLSSGSAAVDAGVDAGVTHDIDGDMRPLGLAPDLGADEVWATVFLPLILRGS